MMRLLLVLLVFPSVAIAQSSNPEEETALEEDMAAARARIRELKQKRTWTRLEQRAERQAQVAEQPRKRSFFAEPRMGWSLLNGQSGGSLGLSIGGVIRERVQLGVSLNVLYSPKAGADWPGAGLAYGGLDTSVVIVNHHVVRLSLGALLGGGAYAYAREGGIEFGSIFTGVPHADIEVRPLRWLGLGVTGGYRFALGHPSASLSFRALSGPEVSGYIRFGL